VSVNIVGVVSFLLKDDACIVVSTKKKNTSANIGQLLYSYKRKAEHLVLTLV